jgi:Protein of unknown function (DUF3370)
MFPLISSILIAQAVPVIAPKPEVIVQPQTIRVLPGQLDEVLMFNSNSPEVVQTEGILLSTFPKVGKSHPEAHLNQAFQGRFDLFAHHISNQTKAQDPIKTLYLGILLHNPGSIPLKVDVLQAASYLSQPDAPFIDLPPMTENPLGTVYAGPGDRVTNDILRRQRQPSWPATLVIPPKTSAMLLNAPIPVKELKPPINGRSTLAYLRSSGSVYAASLAMYAKTDDAGQERAPNLTEWETLLTTGTLSGPRDKAPTLPKPKGNLIYGRVAGVARGGRWSTRLTDPRPLLQNQNVPTLEDTLSYPFRTPRTLKAGQTQRSINASPSKILTIPKVGEAFSYPLSTLPRGTFGTGQIQSAPMVVRYPDTAYAAHGNYSVEYNLTLPLYNPTEGSQKVAVMLQTPLKTDAKPTELTFFKIPPKRVFFRGTVRVRYTDDAGNAQTHYFQLVQFRGQKGEPLVELNLEAKTSRLVQVDFLYPPDATPPQVLTVQTLNQP